jgi:signal transduction histidine kinase
MFRRRLSVVLGLMALVVVVAAWLSTVALAEIKAQVVRGRVASDIATAFVQLSVHKQRLRTWVAQMQQGAQADPAERQAHEAAMQATLALLRRLSAQAVALDGRAEAREEHLRRAETLTVLEQSMVALSAAVAQAGPLAPGADARQAWAAQSQVFDMAQGYDLRRLIAENIAREAAAVERERAAADRVLQRVRSAWLLAAGLLAASALAALAYFGRTLQQRLQRLGEGALALQAGRLGHRIALTGDDEFAALGRSVDAMAAELERHRARESADRQRLEDEVAARTRELAAALDSLRQADARRRRLFADISHELRTPTTVIRGEAEITLRGGDKSVAEYRQSLGRIADTARQLGAVIDDLLAMARSDFQALTMAHAPVDLEDVLAEALLQAAPLAGQHGVRLDAPARTQGGCVVQGDALRLRQLLGVLLDNAIRYSAAGGRVRAALHVQREAGAPGQVVLSVQDEGIGIPADELPQVFDRHFRGAQARRLRPDGSGLGLGIARSLAQAHGGSLTLASGGAGACATLVLPLADEPAVEGAA